MIDTSILQGRTAAYYTLGCKLNFAETSALALLLEAQGVRRAAEGERADLCVVNTCSVTEVADHKGRQAIHRMVREHPGALVVVTGCYAQLQPERLAAIEGVDLVVGAAERQQLVPRLMERMTERMAAAKISKLTNPSEEPGHPIGPSQTAATNPSGELAALAGAKAGARAPFFHSCARGERTRWWLKVQDGCNYFCTYCTIPMARGRSRNAPVADLVAEARQAAERSRREGMATEVVLTGVNIGDFGRTTGERFIDLLRALDAVEGVDRYRISSLEPDLLSDEVIDFVAQSRAFMPHFHVPLQSGSDEVLRLMHRRYDTALFRDKVTRVKQLMPHAFIGVDVMVGTRGERAELFEDTYRFLHSLPVSQLHVFPYSERPGTRALQIPHVVSPQEKHERAQRLIALSDQKTRDFYAAFAGTERPVLLEHAPEGARLMHGFTDNYIRVELPNTPALGGQIRRLRLGPLNRKGDALTGHPDTTA